MENNPDNKNDGDDEEEAICNLMKFLSYVRSLKGLSDSLPGSSVPIPPPDVVLALPPVVPPPLPVVVPVPSPPAAVDVWLPASDCI
jgi:hypothetical protein